MNNLSRSAAVLSGSMTTWLLNLATRLLARAVNMPEPLVQHTGFYVFAHVQAVENRVGKSLCPVRLLRQLRNGFRRPAR